MPITIEEAFGPDPEHPRHGEVIQVIEEEPQRLSSDSERLLAELLAQEGF